MQRYYSPSWNEHETFFLSEEESRHCISVMRNQVGDVISILDGKGSQLMAEITLANPKKTGVIVKEIIIQNSPAHKLHIAISPTKSNDRIEWFIEKACELGIGQITPLICQRTERVKVNLDRWNKIGISACKQANQLYFPVINEPKKFNQNFLQSLNLESSFIASISVNEKLNKINSSVENTILIGPEGDFSEDEFKFIRENKIREINLGSSILRVETAGLVAVSQWNYLAMS